jgi:hypothetical protein
VVNTAATSPIAEVSLFDFVDGSAPPVLIAIPDGTCRTDAPVDAEVLDSEASTEPDSGAEAPSVSIPAAVDVPVGSGVVPVVELPSDSDGPLGPVAPAVPAVAPELVDSVSSAHATPGVVAIAIPTPSATVNPPTRPMYLALLIVVPRRPC